MTSTEWQWIKTAVSELPKEVQTLINEQLEAKSKGVSTRCALHIAGQCSVYSVRPLDCRLQGYSLSNNAPFTCQEEQLRMVHELEHQANPLGYMFMPQRDRLKAVFGSVVSQTAPLQTLFQHLQAYFSQPT